MNPDLEKIFKKWYENAGGTVDCPSVEDIKELMEKTYALGYANAMDTAGEALDEHLEEIANLKRREVKK
jgi:hypothetical protein